MLCINDIFSVFLVKYRKLSPSYQASLRPEIFKENEFPDTRIEVYFFKESNTRFVSQFLWIRSPGLDLLSSPLGPSPGWRQIMEATLEFCLTKPLFSNRANYTSFNNFGKCRNNVMNIHSYFAII